MNKNIDMGFSQRTFDFDQSHEQNLKKVLTFIDSRIADNDQLMVDQVVNHFSIQSAAKSATQSDGWTKPLIRNLINDLFKDDKIHFFIDGKKILYENIKAFLSEFAQSQSIFLQMGEPLSILKTHFSKLAQWKYIEIIKPEVVEESVLLRAKHLGKKLFKDVSLASQNSLCRNLRKHLRVWRNELEEFRRVAGTGNYPGINEIQKGLQLSNKLLDVHEPCKFIETFLNNEDRLCDASSYFNTLKNFYKNQIYLWNNLIKAVESFEPNRMLLEKEPDVKKALETLCKILKEPEPYSMIEEISSLISIVKAANDPVVEKQIASAKVLAIEKIEKKIDEVVKVLDAKKTNNDIRNEALFPLQTSKKRINMASSLQSIADYLNNAIDQFDNAMDMLIVPGS
jgi:hypothetical protein